MSIATSVGRSLEQQELEQQTSAGSAEAQFQLGMQLLDNSNQSGPSNAANWLSLAAEQGHTEAQVANG